MIFRASSLTLVSGTTVSLFLKCILLSERLLATLADFTHFIQL
jgi:hypothetical protein